MRVIDKTEVSQICFERPDYDFFFGFETVFMTEKFDGGGMINIDKWMK